jgi:hypothetical protein
MLVIALIFPGMALGARAIDYLDGKFGLRGYDDFELYRNGWVMSEISPALHEAYRTRGDSRPGIKHHRYAAAMVPGKDDGITSLVVGEWKPNRRGPDVVQVEQIKVGDDPDVDVISHLFGRFYLLQAQAAEWELEDDLKRWDRHSDLQIAAFKDEEKALWIKRANATQKMLAKSAS